MEKEYLKLLRLILETGVSKDDRTGTGTLSLFGYQMRCDLNKGFPLLTTKKLHLKSIIYELLWFLKGDTNIKYLNDNGVHIWDKWADKDGNLGPIYGAQWRRWPNPIFVPGHYEIPHYEKFFMPPGEDSEYWIKDAYKIEYIDQITEAINLIKHNPDSRRIIVNSWNVGELSKMKLAPCHCMFQFYVVNGKLSCQLYQRSADVFLGVPFNIASYALLTLMFAQVCNMLPGEFIHSFGDVHLYKNHIEQAKLQLSREAYQAPKMVLNEKVKEIFDFKFEDFTLLNYHSHPAIKALVAV